MNWDDTIQVLKTMLNFIKESFQALVFAESCGWGSMLQAFHKIDDYLQISFDLKVVQLNPSSNFHNNKKSIELRSIVGVESYTTREKMKNFPRTVSEGSLISRRSRISFRHPIEIELNIRVHQGFPSRGIGRNR